ncbi:cytochrome P450 monooxygenase pc-2 [Stereum hirsutum FP-91666 SS1]|uniref:cytochrome P450 monooxygenase pc-2 n=1 Tax=Stereum hirsutum (strain FP-91666) TaxID=721885 RepID=UPI000440FF4F|nr:cytochrome P450 monooxygenase pc-2 [Stereum hirsutum FP-91666 SS1]EIM92719.1 cytochrome P450 monooxygenase pc-2 [Stereum hirsutum FP-91666 SS1]
MKISPGIRFVFKNSPGIFFSSFFFYFGGYLVQHHSNGILPRWTIVPLSFSILVVLRREWRFFMDKRHAAAIGAVVPPVVEDKWPLYLGNFWKTFNGFMNGYPGDTAWEWIAKYGHTFYVRAGFDERVMTVEPHHVKALLATNFDCWEKGTTLHDQLYSVLGTGVFNSDGDMWKYHRTMTRPFFTKDRISDFENFDRHAMASITLAKERLRTGFPIDFQDLASRFTLDTTTEFLFASDVSSLSAGLPYPSAPSSTSELMHPSNLVAASFAQVQFRVMTRFFFGAWWPLMELWKDQTEDDMKVLMGFVDPILQSAMQKKGESFTDAENDEETFLQHMVKSTDGAAGSLHPFIGHSEANTIADIKVLRDECLNLMTAGRDTTAALLSFGVYMLAEHPHVLQRLRAEVLETVGPSRAPTYEELRGMKYMRAFLNETLRLYPPVPFNLRNANRDTTLPGAPGEQPFYISRGTSVLYSVFVMHRRADLWGPDAIEFDPDRFIDARLQQYLTHNPFIFVPFNAGPRICLGQQFAYNEASIMLVRLLQNFSSVSLAQDVQPPKSIPPASWADVPGRQSVEKLWPKSNLTMFIDGGLWVRLGEAAESTSS